MRLNHLTLVALALAVAPAVAQQSRDDGGSARLQAMVQQLTSEKTQLQADNTKLKTERDAATAELKKLRTEKDSLERQLSQSETSLTRASSTNTRNTEVMEQQKKRTEDLVAQFRQTIEQLRTTELERNDLKTLSETRQRAFEQCVASNQKLFETGNEVLDRYENKGKWDALREREPFTQTRRVRLQNAVDEYRWALDDQRLPGTTKAAGATGGL
jgi:uncharacterized protein (DUF3084 family)